MCTRQRNRKARRRGPVATTLLGATIAVAAAAPAQATFAGANGEIAYTAPVGGSNGLEIFRVPSSGGTAVNVSQQVGNEYQPAWSPDGSKIAAAHEPTSGGQRDIVIYDPQTPGPPVPVTNDALPDLNPAWSPDGSMIVFERRITGPPPPMTPQDFDILVAPSDGSAPPTPVITGPGIQAVPAWSPDGTRLAFTDNSSGSTNVYVVAANGTGPRTPIALTTTSPEGHPDWSPDSARLVLSRDGALLIANADGSGSAAPVGPPGFLNRESPVWSPDATRIAFGSFSFPSDISTVALDGTGETPVVATTDDENSPSWQRVDPPPASPDTAAPETTIVTGPKKKTKKKHATFQFVSSEPGSSFACSLDGSPFAPCASGDKLKVKRGRHTFQVRATDAAGNADSSPAEARWKVKKRRKKHK